MNILCVDIGTGTQDILLYDSDREIENCLKLVMTSPTMRVARTTGAALSPSLTGLLMNTGSLLSVPFFLSGGLKIVYDLLLYRSFKSIRPPEEQV